MSTDETEDSALLRTAFSKAMRAEAGRAGLDQKSLAAKSGVSVGTISNYWHGRTVPRLIELTAIARACGISSRVFYDRIMDEYEHAQLS